MTKKKAVAKRKGTDVGQVQDYGDFSGSGLEDISSQERVIPFINVLQALSPEVEEMDNAKAGMLLNKGSQDLIAGDEGFYFLPVVRQPSVFVEWKPRDAGGGLVGRHTRSSDVVQEAAAACRERGEDPQYTLLWTGEPEKSNELRETHYLYGFVLEGNPEEGDWEIVGQAILSFGSTKIKVYKKFISSIDMLKGRPPLFAHPTLIRTIKEKNNKGEFYNFKLSPANGTLRDSQLQMDAEDDLELMKKAHQFAAEIHKGEWKEGDEADQRGESDEDIPF